MGYMEDVTTCETHEDFSFCEPFLAAATRSICWVFLWSHTVRMKWGVAAAALPLCGIGRLCRAVGFGYIFLRLVLDGRRRGCILPVVGGVIFMDIKLDTASLALAQRIHAQSNLALHDPCSTLTDTGL